METRLCRDNRQRFWICMAITFLWGMAAHATMFLNLSFSHDCLAEFNAAVFGNEWKMQLGRIFVPYYRMLTRGDLTFPWVIGLLGLAYIGLAVFLTTQVFNVLSKANIALIAGIFTVNITNTAIIATYLNDFDNNMFALLLAVMAVYVWKKRKWGFLWGSILLCIVIGIYPAFLSVCIALLLISLILDVLNEVKFGSVLMRGLKALGMLLLGGALYWAALKLVGSVVGVTLASGTYNSLGTASSMSVGQLLSTAFSGWKKILYDFYHQKTLSSDPVIYATNTAIILICAFPFGLRLLHRQIGVWSKLLALALLALLPFGMNVVFALTDGVSHDLMHFGIWMPYVFALLLVWNVLPQLSRLPPQVKKGLCALTMILVAIVLWINVQTANETYLRKNTEHQANLSYFTRVMARMETCDGYVPGETPVVFVGNPDHMFQTMPGFEKEHEITGMWAKYALNHTSRQRIQAYFDYVLLTPLNAADDEIWEQMQSDSVVQTMPSYPQQGCMDMINGVLVVKLGS